MARTSGANLWFNEAMESWSSHDNNGPIFSVKTSAGNEHLARKLVLSVGPWAPEIYGKDIPGVKFVLERRTLHWFEPKDLDPFKDFPCYFWDRGSEIAFYGFPHQPGYPGGVKCAVHGGKGELHKAVMEGTTPTRPHEADTAFMRAVLQGRVPALASGDEVSSASCMYTFTPNGNFLIDWSVA